MAVCLFSAMPLRKAFLATALLGWLFLPVFGYAFTGFPEYDKEVAVSYALALGVVFFGYKETSGSEFRLRWYDLPLVVYCLSPLLTSLANGLGLYDGLSGVFTTSLRWAVPYYIGRRFFATWKDIRVLAIAVVVGGLIYVPLCLFEIRMSPQLHKLVYGFHPSDWRTVRRLGGFRPVVFTTHGLSLGLWMASATLTIWWLWVSGSIRKIGGFHTGWLVALLAVVNVFCRSTGALVIFFLALPLLFATRWWRVGLPILALAIVPLAYVVLRTVGGWSGSEIVDAAQLINEKRAASLATRIFHENQLAEKALVHPWLGWGKWSRNRIISDYGKDLSLTDGWWVIVLGQRGLTGLISGFTVMLLPIFLLLRKVPARDWCSPGVAPAAALAVVGVMFALDCIPNAVSMNPLYVVSMGAVMGLPRPGGVARSDGVDVPEQERAEPGEQSRPYGLGRPPVGRAPGRLYS